MTKSKYLLLDANIVIEAHEQNFWQAILNQFRVALPSIVFHDEAKYFHSRLTVAAIDLVTPKAQGKLVVLEASVTDFAAVKGCLKDDFFNSIDPGELEAIALLRSGNFNDYRFCSGDQLANKSFGVMDLGSFCISLEDVMKQMGRAAKLPPHYSSKRLRQLLAEAVTEKSLYRIK